MTPTPAQIEAAGRAAFEYDKRNSRTTAQWEDARRFYLELVSYALTAAAEVVEPMTQTPAQIEAAARTLFDRLTCIEDRCKSVQIDSCGCYSEIVMALMSFTAVAEEDIEAARAIIEKTDQTVSRLLVKTTIERCAQVAECYSMNYPAGRRIAAAIRDLKDK